MAVVETQYTSRMRFLGIGDTCDLVATYSELLAAGHDPDGRDTGAGLSPFRSEWRAELDWVRGEIVVVESALGDIGRRLVIHDRHQPVVVGWL